MDKFIGKTTEVAFSEFPKIDLKDKKIILVLSKNYRLTPTKIGRMVGLSKEVVHYRIKKMENNGILRGNITVLNPSKMGFQMFIVYFQTQNLSHDREEKLISFLVHHPATHYITRTLGRFDFAFDIIARSIQEFDIVLRGILKEFGDCVKSYDISPILNVLQYRHLPESFGTNVELKNIPLRSDSSFSADLSEQKIQYGQQPSTIDEKDIKIVSILSSIGNAQIKVISKHVNLSESSIKARIQRMIQENIILGFLPIINISALGYHTYGILLSLNDVEGEEKQRLFSFLSQHPDIFFCLHTSGQYEITLNVSMRNNLHLHTFLTELRQKFFKSIKNIDFFLVLKDYKIAFLPGR